MSSLIQLSSVGIILNIEINLYIIAYKHIFDILISYTTRKETGSENSGTKRNTEFKTRKTRKKKQIWNRVSFT